MSRLRKESSAARTPGRKAGPARPSRSSDDPVATRLLALQTSAGNASVSRMMSAQRSRVQREPEPAAATAEADKRIEPAQLEKALVDERNKALAGYREAGKGLDVLEKAEKAGTLSPEDTGKKAALQKAQDEHHALLTQAEKDLLLIKEPGATNQALNDMRARRSVDATVKPTTDPTASGFRLDASGISSAKKDVVSELKDGKATTTTTGSTKTIDSTGYTKADSKSTSVVEGATTTTRQEAKDNTVKKFDLSGGDVSYSNTSTERTSTTTTGGMSTSDATVRSTKFGTGGITQSTENTVTVDDAVASSKESTSVTRGDGRLGATKSTSSKTGTQDSQGSLTKGNEKSTTVGGGVIAGPEGAGGFGSASKDISQTHAKGVKTGQSAGMDGKFVVNVTQTPGKDPAQYQLSLTINLGAKLGASADVEKETSEGRGIPGGGSPTPTGKSNKGISGSLSGSVTGTFVHVFDENQTKAYLAALAAKGNGGSQKEMQILTLASQGKLADAQAMLSGLRASTMSAAGAAGMSEGDSAEIVVEGKAEGKGSFGRSTTGGFGAKASVNLSHGETLKFNVTRKDGKVVVTVAVVTTTTAGGGGSVSYGAASGGHTGSATDTAGQSVSFILDQKDPAYQRHFDTITEARSIEELRRLAAKHPELVGSSTRSMERATSNTTSAGVGPIGAEFAETHSYGESTTTDKDGTSLNVTGSSGGGAAVSVAGGPKVTYNEKDTLAAKVGADKKASGDSFTTTSETDFSESAKQLGKKLSDNPRGTLQGLVTGGTKVMQEKTDVAGMKLSDDDFETISRTAQNPRRWDDAAIGTLLTHDLVAWRGLGKAIVASKGDRTEISRLLARFASKHDHTAKAVNHVVRPAGTAAGGTRYEWPGDLAEEKASYEALVTADPTGPAKQLDAAGKHKEALDATNANLAKLDGLVSAMRAKRDKFVDGGALAEMLRSAATRRGEIVGLAATLRHNLNATDPKAALPPADVTTVPTPEQQKAKETVARETSMGTLEGLRSSLAEEQAKETKAFEVVRAEHARWFSEPDIIVIAKALTDLKNNVYPRWERTLGETRELAKKVGVDEKSIGPLPNKTECNALNRRSFSSDLVPVP